ncbi:recombinase family protein [Anaerosporobacter faecicola]|uniref:recombinase family protein n=1 Tax=Anaerosporobacter faecicola TaxID=2718714 RepID=UPI002ED6325E
MGRNKVYGYARVSTKDQVLERQIRNILRYDSNAVIYTEKATGTKIDIRTEFNKLLKQVSSGDTIIFDSVSRMSRDAERGFELYEELFNKGIELVFIKEPHINTVTYKKALTNNIALTGTKVDSILKGINEYLMAIAKEQVTIAFDQAEKEVKDLQQRTKEGIEVARAAGKQIGRVRVVKSRQRRLRKQKRSLRSILRSSMEY